ncbi:Glu/Leu/Phe/Val dehydrogenase dimerization domain-containing protein [Sphingosinicella sp. GR2756]|uniref:Glu/Leu/Phe/Val dehydrogenase dimerization domain-containing protein n=2 Tax=Sphingosinicella rhizophila TaxID=3050082 RepID=A0ABU3QAC0_9SPHN|nr:Glu/Leu/Phe/Val dehydrogenase dimerization domain-containing protein [Sphingosinicella sp. GR2756]
MAVWGSREFDNHEQVCFFSDEATGLRAIVAIHSTALGPAAGGTRFKLYANDSEAVDDALRLSRAMSYKSALAGLPVGGGKAVIIGDPARLKTRALLHAFGRYVDRIGRHFATGEDVGISVADIETMNEVTPFVAGTSAGAGDPSVHTATGVMHGLRAVLERRFGKSDFTGMKIAVQGLGAVGWGVAQRVHDAGAQLVVADVREEVVARAVDRLGAISVPTARIHASDVDIYVPCALGGVVTERTAGEIRAGAVAGAANNQLATAAAGLALAERGILFAPDYVINAGGVISGLEACSAMPGRSLAQFAPLDESLAAIHDRLIEIFDRADREKRTPEATAEQMARELIGR